LINDFEAPVIQRHPVIGSIKNKLYEQGAVYASMSGSGAAVFGLFREKPEDSEWNKYIRWIGLLN
jgi:4-diphosphocytidyl-2-C-methyl-D-erythritol kinase